MQRLVEGIRKVIWSIFRSHHNNTSQIILYGDYLKRLQHQSKMEIYKKEQFYLYMKNSDWIEAYKCRHWLTEFPHHVVNVLSLDISHCILDW